MCPCLSVLRVLTEKVHCSFKTGYENIQSQVFIPMFITLSFDKHKMKTYKAQKQKQKTQKMKQKHPAASFNFSPFYYQWKTQLLFFLSWISFLTPDHFCLYHFQNTWRENSFPFQEKGKVGYEIFKFICKVQARVNFPKTITQNFNRRERAKLDKLVYNLCISAAGYKPWFLLWKQRASLSA